MGSQTTISSAGEKHRLDRFIIECFLHVGRARRIRPGKHAVSGARMAADFDLETLLSKSYGTTFDHRGVDFSRW